MLLYSFFFGIWIIRSCHITRNIRLIQTDNSDFLTDLFDGEPTANKFCNPPKTMPQKTNHIYCWYLFKHAPRNSEQLQGLDPKKSKKETQTLLKSNSSPLKMVVSKFGISKLPGCLYFQVQAVGFREGNFPTFPTCHLLQGTAEAWKLRGVGGRLLKTHGFSQGVGRDPFQNGRVIHGI